jgi:hypothetical protein
MGVAAGGSVLMWAPVATQTCTQQPATMSPSQTNQTTGSNLWFLLGQLLVPCLPVSSPGCSEPKTHYLFVFSLLALHHRGMLHAAWIIFFWQLAPSQWYAYVHR